MAFILQPDIIRYSCSCESLNPLWKIYFCRHCLKLRCGFCVCHEVDSNYCSNCLENIPSAEARHMKNRCDTCYDCPSCFHTLSIRAVGVTSQNPDDPSKSVTRKFYYMVCSVCRWTSRDAGIPDQTTATGSWPERENPHGNRINILLDYYKVVAATERVEKERKKIIHRRAPFGTYADDRLGMNLQTVRRMAGLSPRPPVNWNTIFPEMKPAEASEEVEELPKDIFEKAPDLSTLTTLPQRLAEPDFQPVLVSQLMPSHKHLFIKRSQRCRSCEHNVSKPEYSPASIKFKIQLSAYYHVPDIRIFTCEPLRAGTSSELIIRISNPTQYATTVSFLPLDSGEKTGIVEQAAGDMSAAMSRMNIASGRLTGSVVLPSCSVILPQRDDAAEYDDSGEVPTFQDDPKVVVWRKGNKAMIKLVVTANDPQRDTTIGFLLTYAYTNTMTPLGGEKERQKVDLQVPVYLKVGKVFSVKY